MIRHTIKRHRILDEIVHGDGPAGQHTVHDLSKRLHLKEEVISQAIFYFLKTKLVVGALTGHFNLTTLGRTRLNQWGPYRDRSEAAKVHEVQEAHNVEYREEVAKQKRNSKQRKSKKQKHREAIRKMRKAGLFAN